MLTGESPIINRRRLREEVLDVLRQMILSGRLQPGEHLLQDRLAAELGVSRTPLREALLKLQEEGLVRFSRTRGVTVTVLDLAELLDLYSVRAVLDGLAAGQAATRAGEAQIELIKAVLDRMTATQLDEREWLALNLQFHEAVYRASGNSTLHQLMSYMEQTSRMSLRFLTYPAQRIRTYYEQHVRIYEAIAAHDPEGAEANARRHIATVEEHVRQEMDAHQGGKA